jgi:hypothetical protein
MRRSSAARLGLACLALAFAAAAPLGHSQEANAQPRLRDLAPPALPAAPANLFWEHPFGDQTTLACTHLTKQHPGGDTTSVPCIHRRQEHPGGHETGARVPCVHWKNGRREHNSDPVVVACTHIVADHPNGDPGPTIPCIHVVQEHPGGHPGPVGPCLHPLPVQRTEASLGLVFFTNDGALQTEVIATVRKLQTLGANVGRPRPLNIFNRPPINGNIEDNRDPFWSHYEQLTHSIQLTKGRSLGDLMSTSHHEVGHALVGHSCVITVNAGGPHSISDASNPALAISEGWAHFVALAVERMPSDAPATYKGFDWEDARSDANRSIPFSKNNEFRAGAILWDFFDSHAEKGDQLNLGFRELFKVWSPTLETLRNGPVLADVNDFVARLKRNNPDKAALIDAIVSMNLTP